MRHTAFDTLHPVVPALFILVTLGLTMFSIQPVLVALSLAGALAYSCCIRGMRATVMALRWQAPVVILVALINPLFVQMGSTELFELFGHQVYLESLCFGATMGGLLLASILWFKAADAMLSYDKALSLLANRIPVIALMVSMVMRLVPQMLQRGREIAAVQGVAMTCARTPSRRRFVLDATRSRLRQSSVLMGWSMEESLQTADTMRARGWGAAPRRTRYARYRFGAASGAALLAFAVLGALCIVFAHAAVSGYSFYPTMTPPSWQGGYGLYALWMALPALLHLVEEKRFV